MKTKLTFLSAMLLYVCVINAQITYNTFGDGSLRLVSQRYNLWNTNTFEWDDSDSAAFNYNAQGLESEKRQFYSPASVWNYNNRLTQAYTAAGKPLLVIDTNFTSQSGSKKFEYTYNGNNQETLVTQYRLSSGNWVFNQRNQTNYTAFDSLNVVLTQGYFNNAWENQVREIYTYNTQNRDTIITSEKWDNSQWNGNIRSLFTWNANGQPTEIINQQYDTLTASYKNFKRSIYTYDGNNRLSTLIEQFRDLNNTTWGNSSKSTYAYNANGDVEQILAEEWNFQNVEWDLYSLFSYTYDSGNKLINYLFQIRSGSSWTNLARRTYTYNSKGYMTNNFQERFDDNTLAWTNFDEWFYWYETNPLFTHIEEAPQEKLFVFPNPANSPVVFVNAQKTLPYAIYDVNGKIITEGQLQAGTNSIILHDSKGLYILKAGNSSFRIVKE